MCGRYYVDDETAREIEKIAAKLDREVQKGRTGDVCPSQEALIIRQRNGQLSSEYMFWGFPGVQKNNLHINARAESVLEKKSFRESVLHRRCVIPAKGFYEWNKEKEKFRFSREEDGTLLFMAGFYNMFREQNRFVILTTEANSSVSLVHERMPLVLERKEIDSWVMDDKFIDYALRKTSPLLKKQTDYEQMKLFTL